MGTTKGEVCLGSYCEDPVGEEAAMVEESSSWTGKELIWRDCIGPHRDIWGLVCACLGNYVRWSS